MYDEKAKARNIRSLQKNYEQVRLTVKKGTLEKYKAFADTQGMSMTAYITQMMEEAMRETGFAAEWEKKEAEKAAEEEASKQAEIDRIKAENAAAMLEGMKRHD